MNTCARCGLSDKTVLDLDTGSTCHPELRDCIAALVARNKALGELVRLVHIPSKGKAGRAWNKRADELLGEEEEP